MKVKLQLKSTSQPIEYNNALNTYTKDGFYCVYLEDETVHKFPLENIFRTVEGYGYHGRPVLKEVNDDVL